MLFAAKCYWPGITARQLEEAGARARRAADRERPGRVAFLGSMLFPDDALVLCLFEAPSEAAVKHASESVGIPCERVMSTVWLRERGRSPW